MCDENVCLDLPSSGVQSIREESLQKEAQKTVMVKINLRSGALFELIMETCSVILTFESVNEILWCDHSNETSPAVLFHGTICLSIFYKMNFGIFLEF